jgi:hypothetical protein
LQQILNAKGNCHCNVFGNFIADFSSLKRYFGDSDRVTACQNSEKLNGHCFAYSATISIVTVENRSILSCLPDDSFSRCSSLSSICIPSSIEQLGECCFAD